MEERWLAVLRELPGTIAKPRVVASDPVSVPALRAWADAIADGDAAFADEVLRRGVVEDRITAPPATLQWWCFPGYRRDARGQIEIGTPADPNLISDLKADGYAHLATETEHVMHGPIFIGDVLTGITRYTRVSDPKRTALGEGVFITTSTAYTTVLGRPVGELTVTLIAYRPGSGEAFRAGPEPDLSGEFPAYDVPVTRSMVVAGATATRDFASPHHDPDFAGSIGGRDILLNMMTTNGMIWRAVALWTGYSAVRAFRTRLVSPGYAGETLRFSGRRTPSGIEVRLANPSGLHASADVTLGDA